MKIHSSIGIFHPITLFSSFLLYHFCLSQQQTSVYRKTNPASPSVVILDPKSRPIAIHQLIVVDAAGYALIRLSSYSKTTPNMIYSISALPVSGSIYQLSQVFSMYGYEPKKGVQILSTSTAITGSDNRLVYTRPNPDQAGTEKWDVIQFIATGSDGVTSFEGSLTLVPPSGAITGSTFFLGNEGWTINGNKVVGPATFESYSRGPLLNRYILGTDDIVDVPPNGGTGDKALWYFEAPSKYWGNFGISYGGQLSFNIGGFAGDFSKLNPDKTNVVELLCASCDGPVSRGQRLGFPLYAALKLATSSSSSRGNLLNTPLQLTLPLLESAGWLRDPQNVLLPWTAPTQCELIQVLSRLSGLRILGDWTEWYETVAIDSVQISNLRAQLPLCSMTMPDASAGCGSPC